MVSKFRAAGYVHSIISIAKIEESQVVPPPWLRLYFSNPVYHSFENRLSRLLP